ncbi:cytochrome c oxidase assembly protein [Nakamurella leprariae]|uniref:Bifunctional copper resistance protein CopD/cytochrome c oxidase assembly protein n=1 Tax=Nakamurella leprariae TaxID=2803911 RepID=A0A938YCP0_9ACTN|nr:cytochrome c oxidase assembly protein [Nakamurella leprariae]MBM9467166.1 bifunctional copper resistance protein CopD/cytochrome c oxidase assembly protein [Nakamurella leprariae]
MSDAPTLGASGRPGVDRWRVTSAVVAAALVAMCVAVGLAASVAPRVLIPGLPDAGRLVEYALPAVKALFDLTAALTVGWLLAAAWFCPPQRSGLLDVGGYRCVQAASLSAGVWTAASLALIPLTFADSYGEPLLDALSADRILLGLEVSDAVRGYLVAAVVAAVVGLMSRVVLRRSWTFALLVVALIGVLPQALGGHSAQSGDHDVAVDTMIWHLLGVSVWVGGLVALLGLARQRAPHLDVVARRYSSAALVAFVAVALSGMANAVVRLAALDDLWLTDYGRLVVLKAVLLVALGVLGWLHRRRTLPLIRDGGDRRPLIRLATVEALLMAATMGVAAALARTASPPTSATVPSDLELVLGFDLDGPPDAIKLLSEWRFDWLLGPAVIAAAALYMVGVVRLRRRGDRWPTGRLVAWLLGCLLVLVATSSGLGRYGMAQFSVHMIAHMVLGMIAPIMLVLGGPTTLALRALPAAGRDQPPGVREALVAALHSRVTRFLTHPIVVFLLFVGSFFALYFTGLFATLMDSHVGHVVMNVHFLVVGYLYYWVIIGVDPTPRRLSPLIKLAMLLGALPFHAFFGLALMNSRSAMATDYFGSLALPWVPDLVDDQQLGGAIAWGATELPMIIVVVALLSQWARSDDREARRLDRRADTGQDTELDAYNAMLAQMAARSAGPGTPGSGDPTRPSGPAGASADDARPDHGTGRPA